MTRRPILLFLSLLSGCLLPAPAAAQGIACSVLNGTVTCRIITTHVDTSVVSFPALHDTVAAKPPVVTPPVVTPAPSAPPPAPPPVVTPTASLGAAFSALTASNCAKTGTAAERYGDDGSFCLADYLAGNTASGAKAVRKLLSRPPVPLVANDGRQWCGQGVVMAYALRPVMTQAQQDSAFANVSGWVRWGIKGPGPIYQGGFLLTDGDQSSSTYLCAALLDARFGTHWLDSSMTAAGKGNFTLGGLGSKGVERLNFEQYVGMCANGGENAESSEYNPNTVAIWALDYLFLPKAQQDSLPTLLKCFQAIASHAPWDITPDFLQAVQWGDEEHPRDFRGRLYERMNLLGLLTGITKSPATAGLISQLVARYGPTGYLSAEPTGWFALGYDARVPIDSAPRFGSTISQGRGHLWVRNRTSLFFAAAENPTGEDHQPGHAFDVQLYRNGEWAIQSPIGYGAPFNVGPGTNTPVYAGLATMAQKGFESADSSGGRWCITGSTSGGLYAAGYYQPPPPFLTIGRRTSCYAQVNATDIVVTRDTVAIAKPTRLDRYRAADLAQMDTTGQWFVVWHPQSTPVKSGNSWTWLTPKGQTVTLSVISDGIISADPLLDEHALWSASAGNPTLGYQLRLHTTGTTLTSVVQVGSALPVSLTPGGVLVGATVILIH